MDKFVINANDFSKVLGDMLMDSAQQQQENILKIVSDEAEKAIKLLKLKSPKDTGEYQKGWSLKKKNNTFVIYNKKYYLTHLLEKGAIRANAGIMPAQPHIAPVFEEIKNNIEKRLGGI